MALVRKIKVEPGSNSYEIRIGSGLLDQAGRFLYEAGFSGKAVIITDATVKDLYGDRLSMSLSGSGFAVSTLVVPVGEEQKSLETAGGLYQGLSDSYAERTTPVLALGGGVIGDLAGFVAATYQRGVPLIQVPTTLLAQVDSSIGGKVAVDHGRLKNMIGVFYQPKLVISDIDTLRTLPEAELANGLAEVIKSAAIGSKKLFEFLENNLKKVRSLDMAVLEEMVVETARIKAEIVSKDEKDLGLRNILNFGHTAGHAIETVSKFRLKHGQAVAIGMMVAARISNRMGLLDKKDVDRLEKIINKAGLPAEMYDINIDDVMSAMKHDKKISQGKIRFVLLKAIGNAIVTEVSPSLVEEVLVGSQ
jgi:3-dehydroquinate synthase